MNGDFEQFRNFESVNLARLIPSSEMSERNFLDLDVVKGIDAQGKFMLPSLNIYTYIYGALYEPKKRKKSILSPQIGFFGLSAILASVKGILRSGN